jgi:hypothetical protein
LNHKIIPARIANKLADKTFAVPSLGWIISGKLNSQQTTSSTPSLTYHTVSETEEIINPYTELQTRLQSSGKSRKSQNLKLYLLKMNFQTTSSNRQLKYLKTIIFQVDIPLKTEHKKLGNSLAKAQKRFFPREKITSNSITFSEYTKFIHEYISLGYAKYVPLTQLKELSENKYFIPHLCVIIDSITTNSPTCCL